jgi:hypothetical protein
MGRIPAFHEESLRWSARPGGIRRRCSASLVTAKRINGAPTSRPAVHDDRLGHSALALILWAGGAGQDLGFRRWPTCCCWPDLPVRGQLLLRGQAEGTFGRLRNWPTSPSASWSWTLRSRSYGRSSVGTPRRCRPSGDCWPTELVFRAIVLRPAPPVGHEQRHVAQDRRRGGAGRVPAARLAAITGNASPGVEALLIMAARSERWRPSEAGRAKGPSAPPRRRRNRCRPKPSSRSPSPMPSSGSWGEA